MADLGLINLTLGCGAFFLLQLDQVEAAA